MEPGELLEKLAALMPAPGEEERQACAPEPYDGGDEDPQPLRKRRRGHLRIYLR